MPLQFIVRSSFELSKNGSTYPGIAVVVSVRVDGGEDMPVKAVP